jgi:poly(hydroxyalkanoate) depolymerase family esterase
LAKALGRSYVAMVRTTLRAGARANALSVKAAAATRKPPRGEGDWVAGISIGRTGARKFRLYRPPGVLPGERLPLLVMLHGCGQDAKSFAESTRMNRTAARNRFLVLYPEQDRYANAQGCWNWFDTRSGRAQGEAELIMRAIDQVCSLYAADRERIAVAGLSAGASMAAFLVTQHPGRFKALMMHSGIAPGAAHSTLSAIGAMHGRRVPRPLDASAETMAQAWPPLLVIHGREDGVVSSVNAHAAVQVWADASGASASDAREVRRGQRYPMTVTDFKRKRETVAQLVQVDRLGHAWSGGAANQRFSDGRGPDASRMLWAFAARQFRGLGGSGAP